jgi:hypothetical protein
MKKITKLLLAATVTLMISGCGMSNLSYDNKQLTLQVEKAFLQLDGILLKQRRDNFSSLYLTQKVLRLNEGNLVVYEDASTDILYEFEPTTTRSIQIIFEAKSIIRVYAKSHLYAYQLILKDGRILNVVAQQNESQQLRFVYGMNTDQLNKMLKQLDPDAKGAYYKQVIRLQDEHHAIFSKWDVQKIHFVPLVVPLPRLMGM